MARVVMNVLENCFPLYLDMVAIAGDFKKYKNWQTNFPPKLLIYRIGLSEWTAFERHRRLQNVYVLTESAVSKLEYPSNLFVVSSPSSIILRTLLKRMKHSATWKAKAIYYFVNEEPESCDKVDDIFREVWEMNVYNAAYVCFDESKSIQFFCFNPFKNASPKSWRFSHFTPGINNNVKWPMAIFKFVRQSITTDLSLCPNPKFDKTNDLNNYPIILRGVFSPVLFQVKKPILSSLSYLVSLNNYEGPDAVLTQILCSYLRAQPFFKPEIDVGFVSKNNTLSGLILQISQNEFDMSPNKRYLDNVWRLQTFPRFVHGICIITLMPDRNSPPLEVIFIQFDNLWCSLLLSGAAVLALVYALKVKAGKAFLEVLQLMLNMTSHFQLENSCYKRFVYIYIAFVFFIYNSLLSSSITPKRYSDTSEKPPQTLDEILEAGYTPTGYGKFKDFLTGTLAQEYVSIDLAAYMNLFFQNVTGKLAYFSDCEIFKTRRINPKIIISNPLFETYVAHLVREDWPLLTTVDTIIHRLVQSGITLFLDRIAYDGFEKIQYDRKLVYNMHEELAMPISVVKVLPIVHFVFAGLSLAFFVFLLEICWSKFYKCKIFHKKMPKNKKLDNLMILRFAKARGSQRRI